MKVKKIQLFLVCVIIVFAQKAFSTHIVGGTLTYIHNGGSSYTVTLKLYRDCSNASNAQFPNSVTISVVGYDGAPFSPSRDITMPIGSPISFIPSNLDPCATPPNPMPCTQEAIYTTTVNNLPPNPGGYHMYFQIVARNLSLINVDATCNCIGESFYAYIPGSDVSWAEEFPQANGTTVDVGSTAWTTSAGSIPASSAGVNSNQFQITGANSASQTWTSQVVNISSFTSGINAHINLSESGTLDANDSILVYYRVNNGPLTLFSTNGSIADDFSSAMASQSAIIGNTFQVIIRVVFDVASPNSEIYKFDNIFIDANNFTDNNNPQFTLFPPLFLCVNTPFTFDHSATDSNGDSLVYQFYTPFNGEANAGPLDPTFSNNSAIFSPIIFQPGFSTNAPLGSGPFNLNSQTGLLTGTPNALGQYVVGVLVKEFRNGVYLSSTYRDFQFNVILCPTFAPAVLSPLTSCNSNTVTFSNLGGSSGANWKWDFGDLTTSTDVSTLNNPTYTYPGPGSYTVSLTTGFGTPCANTATATLVVSSLTSSFSNNAPKCAGSAVAFTNTSTNSANTTITGYSWNFGDATAVSNLQNPSHTYTTAGTYTVLLTITTSGGCTDTTAHAVVINPLPIANAGVNQSVCGNNALVTLNGLVTNAAGGTWTSNGTGTFNPNNTTLNATYTPSAADTAAGSIRFILTTTGNNVCAAKTDTMLVTINNAPTIANAGADQIICGTTTATVVGNIPQVGTGQWSIVSGSAAITNPNNASTTITGLTAGSSVVLKWTISSPLCTPTFDNVTVSVDLSPTTAFAGTDQNLCAATTATLAGNIPSVGSGTWTLISGSATITNPTSPTSTITGLVAGVTTVLRWTITQGVCSSFDEVSIINNLKAIVNAGANQVYCAPTNIQLSGSVTGGTTTGTWTTLGSGTFTPNANTLNATYVLSSTDITNGTVKLILTSTNNATSCSAIKDTVLITFSGFNGISAMNTTNVSCFGANNGTASVSIVGGISPFTYFWNTVPSQTTSSISNLSPGNYSVIITDANGCTSQSSATITQPQVLSASVAKTNISCFGGSNGTATVSPAGGTAPYTYLWSPGNLTTATISNLTIGTYSAVVTDAKNCTATISSTITQPAQLAVSAASTNISCFDGNNGTITATPAGGTTPYNYSWSPSGSASSIVTGLAAGTYNLTLTDAASCMVTSSVTLIQPTALTNTVTSTNETCNNLNNGNASVVVNGGTPNYSYLWLPGNMSTSSVSNLTSGSYNVTVTDSKGCSKVSFVTITEPTTVTANFINQSNVSCFGGNNGAVTVNAAGGTPSYGYSWLPTGATTATINTLPPNTYTVTVTDTKGCTATNSVTITQPSAALALSVLSTPALCFGNSNGTASSTPTGGTAPYVYSWTPGNIHTQNIQNIIAGTYQVKVVDANGCSIQGSVAVAEPTQIALTTSSITATCSSANGGAQVTATGGVGAYQFLWSPTGGTNNIASNLFSDVYTIEVTDGNGCTSSQTVNVNDATGPNVTIISTTNVSCFGGNDGTAAASVSNGTGPFTFIWSPSGGNDSVATGLSAGVYTVIVQDANLCQSLATTSPAISQPTELQLQMSSTNATCNEGSNGSAMVIASGATPGYTYLWPQLLNTNNSVSNLTANNYIVQVTDANGCVKQDTVVVIEPSLLQPTIASQTNVSCFGGSNATATISVTGGTPFYNYNWTPSGGNGPTATGLINGAYTVGITDANNCSASININITQPSIALSATATSTGTSCFGGSNGTGNVTVIGGTPSYSYEWLPSGGNAATASNLAPGNYIVNIKDVLNCQTIVSVNIAEPQQMEVNILGNNASCGFTNGSITSVISGGTAPFNYLWSNSSVAFGVLNNIGPGSYWVNVTDANNCSATSTSNATIVNIPAPTASIASSNPTSCFGGANGVAIAQVSQGTLPYIFNWLPFGGNNLVASTLTEGSYTFTVTDALGCIATANTIITQPTPITITASPLINVSCFGGSNGALTIQPSGGTPTYNYLWSAPLSSTQQTVSNLTAGTYTVTVLDQNSCTSSVTFNITQPTALSSNVISTIGALCFNGTGGASVIGVGGTLPYSYSWATTPIQTGSIVNNLPAGSNIVTVTDANGCSTTNTAVVSQPTQIATIAAADISICIGTAGTITANANGGAGTYIYTWLPSGVINTGSLNVSPIVTTNYYVTATDQNGCVGLTDTITANILNLQQNSIYLTGAALVCPGKSTQLAVQINGTTGPLTYSWNNNLGNGTGPFTVFPNQTITYVVAVSNQCGITVQDSVTVSINPPPAISLSSDTTKICAPNSIQFDDNSVTGNTADPIVSWLWNFGDGTTSNEQNPIHSYVSAGAYLTTLTVTTTVGCSNNNATIPYIINAYAKPTAAFSVNATELEIPSQSLICTNQSVGASTYLWNFGNGSTATDTNPIYLYPDVGIFTVQLISSTAFGCKDTAEAEVVTNSTVNFPNAFTPNRNSATGGAYDENSLDNDVFFPYTKGVEDYLFQVFNRWGELIFESNDLKIGWDGYYKGKLCQDDVYIWKVNLKFKNGKSFTKTGDVTLLR